MQSMDLLRTWYDLKDLGPTMRVRVQGRYFMPHDRFNNQCFLIVVVGGRL